MNLLRRLDSAKRELLLYVVALAIQRGTLVVMVPVMSRVAGIDGLGLYMVAMAVVYFGAPFLSLSGVPAIFRESMEDRERGARIFYGYLVLTALLALSGVAVARFLPHDGAGLVALAPPILAMAFAEAHNQKVFIILRVRDQAGWFLGASIARIVASVAVAFAFASADLGVAEKVGEVLTAQALAFLVIGLAMMWGAELLSHLRARLRGLFSSEMAAALRYTIPMIPHNASLWAINAMGRLFVFRIEGEVAAGYFGGVSSIASICALFNVAMSNLLPKPLYADFDRWIEQDRIRRLFGYIVLAFWGLYLAIMAASFVDRAHVGLMQIYTPDYPWLLALLMMGFLWLIPYYFYGNILIFHRKTWLFSLVTVIALFVALALFQMLIEAGGLIGAGIATVLVQMLHAIGMAAAAMLREPRIGRHLAGHFAIFAVGTAIIGGSAVAMEAFWA